MNDSTSDLMADLAAITLRKADGDDVHDLIVSAIVGMNPAERTTALAAAITMFADAIAVEDETCEPDARTVLELAISLRR